MSSTDETMRLVEVSQEMAHKIDPSLSGEQLERIAEILLLQIPSIDDVTGPMLDRAIARVKRVTTLGDRPRSMKFRD